MSEASRTVAEPLTVERVGRFGFPTHHIVTPQGAPVAEAGRYSWLAIYFGTGQRLRLPDGTRWRTRSVEQGGSLCPVIATAENRRVAMATPGVDPTRGVGKTGHYAIDGADYGFRLVPGESRLGRPGRWLLVDHSEEIAWVTRRPNRFHPDRPVPLGAALLGLLLARFGMPGDADFGAPRFRWD